MGAVGATLALRARLVGLASAVLGTAVVLAVLVGMNLPLRAPTEAGGGAGSSISVLPTPPPKQQQQVRPPPPPRRTPPRTAPAPPGLAGGLAGLDFGLPQYDPGLLDAGDALQGARGDVVMTDDSVDEPPRPLRQTPMQYPPRAKAQGVTGYVLLNLLIGPTGQVERVDLLEGHPAGVFDAAAIEAVRRWTFEPASYRGEHVRVWAQQKVRFDLAGA